MNAAVDTAGVQTWAVIGTGAVAVAPLPAEEGTTAKAPPHPDPRPQAGEEADLPPPAQPRLPDDLPIDTHTATIAQPAAFAEPPSGAGMVGTTIVTLALVIGFILLLAWVAKRMPGIGSASNPALKIVGSLPLGPRERVVVVAVGETQLVLATGPNGTRALHTLDTPLPIQASAPSPFAQVLAQQFGKKKS